MVAYQYHLPAGYTLQASVAGAAVVVRQIEDATIASRVTLGAPATFGPYLVDRSFEVVGEATVAITDSATHDVYTLPNAAASVVGGVLQAAAQANSTAIDVAGVVTDFNALLAKLRTAGTLASA